MGSAAANTVILIVTTILCKLLGFVRELCLSYVYGATATSDAYVVAFSIPYIVFAGVGTAILTSYIPIATRLEKQGRAALREFHNSVVTLVILLSAAVIGVFLLLDKPIVKLFAIGFDDATLDLTVSLSRVMILSVLFIGVYNIIQAYLQMKGRFTAVGLVSVPLNLCVILTLLIAPRWGNAWLGWGVVAGYFLSFLMLWLDARRVGFSYRPCFRFGGDGIRRLFLMVGPIFLSKTVQQINVLLDRTLASTLETGSVSAVNYANRIIGFVTSVFVTSIATAIFPQLSRFSVNSNTKKLKEMLVSSIGVMSFIVLPISVGMCIFSREVVTVLFFRGAFTEYDVARTAQVVLFYAAGLLFFSVKDVLFNVFYAVEDSKTPTVNSVVALFLNLGLNLLLMRWMGVAGLALATTVSGFLTMLLMGWSLRRKMGRLGLRALAGRMLKMLACTAVMAVAVLLIYDKMFLVTASVTVSLLVAVLAGAAIYFGLAVLLRIKEMGMIVVAVYNHLRRAKPAADKAAPEAPKDPDLPETSPDLPPEKEKPAGRGKRDGFDFEDDDNDTPDF